MMLLAARRNVWGYGYDVLSGADAAYRRSATGTPRSEPWSPTPRTAVEALVADNLAYAAGIVHNIANRYRLGNDREDLKQAGYEALARCAKRYDPSRGVEFRQYFPLRVAGAVLDEARARSWNKRRPVDMRLVSLDVCLQDEDDRDITPTWFASPMDDIDGWLDGMDLLAGLEPREQYILLRKAAGYTLNEIGDAFGLTDVSVSKIVRRAYEKMGVTPDGSPGRRAKEAAKKRARRERGYALPVGRPRGGSVESILRRAS